MFRDAKWVQDNIGYVVNDLQRVDRDNIDHIEKCPSCSDCLDHLMEFYSGCERCSRTEHKGVLNYIEEEGFYLCNNCFKNYDN